MPKKRSKAPTAANPTAATAWMLKQVQHDEFE